MGAVRRNGAPGKSRTCDLLVRSQTLYPAELRAPRCANAVQIDYDTRAESSTISQRIFSSVCLYRAVQGGGVRGHEDDMLAAQIFPTIYGPWLPYYDAKRDDDRTTMPTKS